MTHETPNTQMRTMVLVYLPTKLGDFVRANVGVHIPAPWFANLGHSYYGDYSAYSDYSSHCGNHNSLN
jgi:hypothetical protein